MNKEDAIYEYWFARIRGISDKKKRKLKKVYGRAEAIYYIEETSLKKQEYLTSKDIDALILAKKQRCLTEDYNYMQDQGIRMLFDTDPNYPEKLKELSAPPYVLFVKGNMPDDDRKTAAIVGARRCTPYGEQMALEYGEVLARAGVQIISGMAKGIDGAGHRGALNGNGETFAVLGCGVDVCYPREHIGLYQDMLKSGGIISEQPPKEPPLPMYFPMRNRIISGLADLVLVIEAKEKSGSLITADQALDQGKDIYALPGPVTSPGSQGCHRLIRQGAGILISPDELLDELDLLCAEETYQNVKKQKVLESAEELVYSKLDLFPKSFGYLLAETRYQPKELMQTITKLEIKGYIKELSKNHYIKIR